MTLVAPPPDRSDALERVLGDIAISIRSQRRIRPDAHQDVALDGLSLVYVLAGRIGTPADTGLPGALRTGDALLFAGRALTVHVSAGSSVLISRLAWADSAAHLGALLPETAWIRHFDDLEPAAAALAQHMGGDSPVTCERGGDLAICRTMATTLLQSVIRAWTGVGCAPQGWPARSADPFLERVVEAVDAEPGGEWSVETMASVSALSRSVFAERFRIAFGVSPAQYVTEVRMRAARALLVDGRGVSEVSRELGYSSDEGFSRAFRRHTGMTPSAFRSRGSLASA